jgi:ABC-type multidrug transport system fused ATPase/permease subunit
MASTELNDRVAKAIAAHLGKSPKETVAHPIAPPVPKSPTTLEENQVWFSEVFGYKPKFGDFGVSMVETPSNSDIARLIPSVDPDYVLQHDEAALLVAGMQDGDKTLITGPTGSGKSDRKSVV